MKAFFLNLCAFVIFAGLLRCLVSEERFAKYFSLISGILLLVLIVRGFPKVEIDLPEASEQSVFSDSAYEDAVIARSEQVLSDRAQSLLSEQGIACTVRVTLTYENDAIALDTVRVQGIRQSDTVSKLLGEYFSVEENVIEFDG